MGGESSVYISVDIEADGPIPGPYSMISIGAALAATHHSGRFQPADPERDTFYRELRPISEQFEPDALAVSGLDRKRLLTVGADPRIAVVEFVKWIDAVSHGGQPVMVSYAACFDWMFVHWYLHRFGGHSPFGHAHCLDIKGLYATKAGLPIADTRRDAMPARIRPSREHTHHALDDAIEQAELFVNVMVWNGDR